MKKWQKISAAIFFTAMLLNFAPVSAGDGYTVSDSQNNISDGSKDKDEEIFEESFGELDEVSNDELPPPENNIPIPNINDTNKKFENHNDDSAEENFNPPESEDDEIYSDEDEDTVHDTGIIGDVNGDNQLNAVDLVILQKYLKGNVFYISESAADINGDGTISAFDVHALLNLIKAENKGTGDVNNDGKVDIYDVQSLTNYLADKNTPINSGNADLNGDGKISTEDLKILREVISALQQ